MINKDKTRQAGQDIEIEGQRIQARKFIWKQSSAIQLMEKLQSVFSLEFFKIDILASSSSNLLPRLDTIVDPELRKNNVLENCLHNKTCDELKELVKHLGE